MTQQYRRVEKTLDEIIEEHLRTEPLFLYSGVVANVKLGVQAVENNEIDEEHHRWRGDVVRSVLQGCASRGMFAQNGSYLRALDAVYERFPQKGRTEANNRAIISAAGAHQVPFDAEHLIDLVATPEVWAMLHDSRETLDQRQSNQQREWMIDEITKGGTQGFTLMTQYGGRRVFDKDGYEVQYSSSGGRAKKKLGGFENMSDEEIQQIHAHVMEKRAAIEAATNGTLKKQVKQLGENHYQGKFHGDPGSRQPATTPGNAILIDPRDGQAITRRIDLIHYINSSSDALAKLVKPKGTTIRERALEVDRLLGARE